MAKNDFSAEAAENYEQKCLCVLVLDISGSMNEVIDNTNIEYTGQTVSVDGKIYDVVTGGISKLDNLISGLHDFYNEIENDATTSQRLELSIVTFGDYVQTIQEPALISNSSFPVLEADGDTAMVDAVYEAIDLVAARKQWYKSTNQPYYRPWIILMTDGEPNANQNVPALAQRIQQDTASKKYEFLPIGVDNANMSVLQQIQGRIPAMKLKGTKFSSFFKWLSASMGTVVSAEEGQTVDLSNGSTDWMESFSI
ncbi:MAG: VWA domain-containing protein [Bacteroidaceae bacterium]|nr:VWA domain-containing protein [Bacteroidaceae bacterium]